MDKFEIGRAYCATSICDSGCVYVITVTGRTPRCIRYVCGGRERLSKIRVGGGGEYVRPDSWSMAPVFRASRPAAAEPAGWRE
jgi:hypothetical protein